MVEFETININELKPAEYNPRYMPEEEMSKLRNNLETFGLVDPIIIDLTDENTVIGGHQRLEVLKEIDDEQNLKLLRLGDVGLIFRETDLKIKDKNDQKALNLSLNKISGEWDYSKLDDLLLELNEDNYQIELTGFGQDDLLEINEIDFSVDEEELFQQSPNNSQIYDDQDPGALQKYFLVPPFSVISAGKGDYQSRNKEWLQKTGNLSLSRNTSETGTLNGAEASVMTAINEGTSNFSPFLAEILCKWFTPRNPCWIDPFGGEQTKGVVAGELGIPYHAVEIREEQVLINKKATKKYKDVHYYCGDSKDIQKIVPTNEQYNFCLTSPPYYDLELYSKGMTDSISYEEFMEQYKYIFSEVYSLLQENSFLVLKLGEVRDKRGDYYGFISDNIKIMREIGFNYYNEIILQNAVGTAALRAPRAMRTRKTVHIHQNILVFYKGTPQSLKKEMGNGGMYPIIYEDYSTRKKLEKNREEQ